MQPLVLKVNYSRIMDMASAQIYLATVDGALTFPGPVLRYPNRTLMRNSQLVYTENLILDKTNIHSYWNIHSILCQSVLILT